MTIKEELIKVLERIAATIPSRKVTILLFCEGNPEPMSMYGTKSSAADITVLSATATAEVIKNILTHAYNETKATRN